MKLELKKYKNHPGMAEESPCFEAELWADGIKIADVHNRGTGGSHDYYWQDIKLWQQLNDWAEAQDLPYEHEKLDQLVNRLMARADDRKWLLRKCREGTVCRTAKDKPGEWTVYTLFPWPANDKLKQEKLRAGKRMTLVANEDIEKALDLMAADRAIDEQVWKAELASKEKS
jgi:hypothetical protein